MNTIISLLIRTLARMASIAFTILLVREGYHLVTKEGPLFSRIITNRFKGRETDKEAQDQRRAELILFKSGYAVLHMPNGESRPVPADLAKVFLKSLDEKHKEISEGIFAD